MSKGAATKDRIIESALRTASVEGLEGISLGRLAADVGMSKSGLFAHFASKEELQIDVLEAASARFAEIVVKPAMQEPRGEPRVRSLFEHWLVWERHESLPGGCIFMHAAAELDDRPGPARDALVRWQRQWLDVLAKAARTGGGDRPLSRRPGFRPVRLSSSWAWCWATTTPAACWTIPTRRTTSAAPSTRWSRPHAPDLIHPRPREQDDDEHRIRFAQKSTNGRAVPLRHCAPCALDSAWPQRSRRGRRSGTPPRSSLRRRAERRPGRCWKTRRRGGTR